MSRMEYYSIFYNCQGAPNLIAWYGSDLDIYTYTEPNQYILGKKEMFVSDFLFTIPYIPTTERRKTTQKNRTKNN